MSDDSNLPMTQAQIVEALTANGLSEATIRQELGMTPHEWKAQMQAPDSPLAQAIADGRGRLVESAMSVIIESIKAGDVATAKWLFEKFAPQEKQKKSSININLTMPMSMEDYLKVVDAEVIEE